MYAIIQTGGKQYRVAEGQTLKVESLARDADGQVIFDQVLAVGKGKGLKIGSPLVDGAKVTADVLADGRAKKIEIIKFKRRKHHMKRQGHRQNYTEVKITAIEGA